MLLNTSTVLSWNTFNLFRMIYILSSPLPLILPLSISLVSITSMGQSKYKQVFIFKSEDIFFVISVQVCIFQAFLGNPSRSTVPFLIVFSQLMISLTPNSLGTSLPSSMYELSSAESGPLFLIYALNKSPSEICLNPNYFYMQAEWVPFPEPGPPITAIKSNFDFCFCFIMFCTIFFALDFLLIFLFSSSILCAFIVGFCFINYSPFCTIFCLYLYKFFLSLFQYCFDRYLELDYRGTDLY